jgi:hypothetical protein
MLLSGSKYELLQVHTKVPEENSSSAFRVEAEYSKKYEMDGTCSTQGMVSKYSSWIQRFPDVACWISYFRDGAYEE